VFAVQGYRAARDEWLRKQRELRSAFIDFRNRHDARASNITRKNTRRAYERVYADDGLLGEYLAPERVEFYEEVAEICASRRPLSVIDVGCGAGNLLHAVVEKTSAHRVVGIDYAQAGIERARQLVPSGEFHARSLYELDLAETFDVVLCTEVLEHLSDPDAAMRVLAGLCAHNGTMVITVPDGAADSWEGHRNFWTESELVEFLRDYGAVQVSRMRLDEASLLAVIKPHLAEREDAANHAPLPHRA
jgi:2-polyprenyl-3-methyl-5-hydroxy-6-metoxy-1,4-benzoquinol methylase